jgi:hypothetical protein
MKGIEERLFKDVKRKDQKEKEGRRKPERGGKQLHRW